MDLASGLPVVTLHVSWETAIDLALGGKWEILCALYSTPPYVVLTILPTYYF